MEKKIEGGYILLARNLIESEIWRKPPAYLKIWIYILSRVNWKKSKENDIGEALFIFTQEKIPGVKLSQIYDFLRWAKTGNSRELTTQITTQKTTRGIRLKVTKYAYYQDVKNYKFQDTFQDAFQENSNTIPKTLNKGIYNTHTIGEEKEKSVCVNSQNLSNTDLEILKKYAKANGARRIAPYVHSLIKNGGYTAILKEEKEKQEKLERQKAKEVIPPPEDEPDTLEDIEKARAKARAKVTQIRKRREL